MKIHFAWLIPVALVAGLFGAGVERTTQAVKHSQQASLAGQTLANISVSLENEREENGMYPDSLADLHVSSRSGEFSEDILKDAIYFRTEDGYVIFVGLPNVAYFYPGVGVQFQ